MAKQVRTVAKPSIKQPAWPGLRSLLTPEKAARPKLCLTGFCVGSREYTPYDDPEFLVVGLNQGRVFMPRGDVWFELHGPDVYEWEIRRPHKHLEWLAAFNGPVFMHQRDERIPRSVTYPLKEVSDNVGINLYRLLADRTEQSMARSPYLTSSIAMQLALAIMENYREIWLCGIDLNTDSEYAWQKPGVEHLMGIAAGRGIKIVVPDECALLKGKIYGRGFMQPGGEDEIHTKSQYEMRLESLRKKREQLTVKANQMIGAKRELDYWLEQMVPGLDHEKMCARQREMQQAVDQTMGELNQTAGAERELYYWIAQTKEGQDPTEAIAQIDAQQAELKARSEEQPEARTNGHAEIKPTRDLVEVA